MKFCVIRVSFPLFGTIDFEFRLRCESLGYLVEGFVMIDLFFD